MREKWARKVMQWLRIPQNEPAALSQNPPVAVWQPDEKRHNIRFAFWLVPQIVAVFFLITATFEIRMPLVPEQFANVSNAFFEKMTIIPGLFWLKGLPWLIYFFEFMPRFIFFLLRLDIRSVWFFIDEDGIGSREGVWTLREKYTMWKNVQTFSIKQGLIQNWLGLGNIVVRVAGADKDNADKVPKRAIVFRDIADAKKVYDSFVTRLETASKKPQPSVVQTSENKQTVISAAREVLAETRLLRASTQTTVALKPEREPHEDIDQNEGPAQPIEKAADDQEHLTSAGREHED